RARHLALSSEGSDEHVAAALEQAAQAAAARGAPAAGAELAELAAALTPLDRLSARWRRRADAAGYLFRAGHTPRARRQLEAPGRAGGGGGGGGEGGGGGRGGSTAGPRDDPFP